MGGRHLVISLVLAGLAASAEEVPQARAHGLAWEFVAGQRAGELEHGVPEVLQVRLRNVGRTSWTREQNDHLAYHWLGADGTVAVHDGVRTELPHALGPGEEVVLQARVEPPSAPGDYTLQWEMVREGVTWYGPPQSGQAKLSLSVSHFGWELLAGRSPGWVSSQGSKVTVRLKNTGQVTWDPAHHDGLAYHWLAADGTELLHDGVRTVLPHPVAPGEEVELQATVDGLGEPALVSQAWLQWEMVRDGVKWYGPPPFPPARVTILVLAPVAQLLFAGASVLLCAVLVVGRHRSGGAWRGREWLPVTWTLASVLLTASTVAHCAGMPLELTSTRFFLCGAALVCLPVALTPARWRWAAGAVLALLVALLGMADVSYVRVFGTFIPVEALGASHQLSDVGASVSNLLHPEDAWLAPGALGVLLCAVAAGLPRSSRAVLPERDGRALRWARLMPAAACTAAGLFAVGELSGALHEEAQHPTVYSEQDLLHRWGMVNAHLYNAARAGTRVLGSARLSGEDLAQVRHVFAARHAAEVPPPVAAAPGASVLLVQAESLQSFVLGLRVEGREVTPFLNRLRERTLSFTAIYDQTQQGRTSDAEFAVLNSLHPLEHGAVAFRRSSNTFLALPEVLRRRGYATLSSHANDSHFWNRSVLHPRYGFERLAFGADLGAGLKSGWGLVDGVFLDRLADRLQALPPPFMAFSITVTSHHPYDLVPPGERRLPLGPLEGTMLGNYLQSVNYLDRSLEQLFARLERDGLMDDLVVAVYGDHDAGLEPTPELMALLGRRTWGPLDALEADRIPLLVRLPGEKLRGEVATVGGHVDIAPTVLHLLGVPPPPCFIGTSLLASSPRAVPHPSGATVGDELVSLPSPGEREGRCVERATRAEVPAARCEELAARGAEERQAALSVVNDDLGEGLGCGAAGADASG